MRVYVYYCEWDGKNGSHDLLRLSVCQYLKDRRQTETSNYNKLSLAITQDKENGKPYLKEMRSVHFSISHSGTIWSCAFGEEEVGLDLQVLHEGNGEKIARRFYHPMEIRWLEKNGFDQFSRLWAYKESYVKYTGDGLINGLDYFSVVPGDFMNKNDVAVSMKTETEKCSGKLGAEGVCQQEVPFRDNFWMVVTSEKEAQVVLKELQPFPHQHMERK